jgi:hypothetical protein
MMKDVPEVSQMPGNADIKTGQVVRLVSLTNGQTGPQTMRGSDLAHRCRAEARPAEILHFRNAMVEFGE